MKELTIEEKAKAYDEALKRARIWKDKSGMPKDKQGILDDIFPELKESDDEILRKWLIKYFDKVNDVVEVDRKKIIAWLEKQRLLNNDKYQTVPVEILDRLYKSEKELEKLKQGEQKSTDKVEPEFKIEKGKWYVCDTPRYADFVVGKAYFCPKNEMLKPYENGMALYVAKHCFHLWTIQDAKDGDVLVCKNGWTCIFKTLINNETFSSYCFMDNTKWFCETGSECHTLKEEFVKAYNGKIYPATKEQRDQLEKAIADAGYTFDFEKKELKKVEQKSTEWSEEDESILQGIWDEILANKHNSKEYEWKAYDKFLDWLKSLKDRVQPKQEWSEEDIRNIDVIDTVLFYDKDLPENTCVRLRNWLESLKPQNNITDEELVQAKKDAYNDALDKIEYHSGEPTFDDGWSAAIDYIRKKYLKPQNHWKPTEEQVSTMKYLAKYYAKGCDEPTRSIIEGLYEQLKQL